MSLLMRWGVARGSWLESISSQEFAFRPKHILTFLMMTYLLLSYNDTFWRYIILPAIDCSP